MNEQSPDVIVTPLRHGLLAGSDNYLNLLIQVQAPDTPDAATHTLRPIRSGPRSIWRWSSTARVR